MSRYQESIDAYGNSYQNQFATGDQGYGNGRSHGELDEIETSKSRQCIKTVTKFLVSHVGLVGLVVLYAVAGGFLFQLLERHQDILNCQEAEGENAVQLVKLKQKIVSYIQFNTTITSPAPAPSTSPTLTYVLERDNQSVAYDKIASILYNYRDFIITTGSKYRYYGDDCSYTKWTLPNSLLFAITIITTIGYGNITPVTWEGQVCCICYATIGIPIFLLCIANISHVLGAMFRFIYSRICCAPCHAIKRHRVIAKKAKMDDNGMVNNHGNASGWTMDDENNNEPSGKKHPPNTLVNENEGEDLEQLGDQRVTVPLTITMLIIACYIFFGSLIFHNFEGWTMTQAGYFCFITLATIGFGDFVPGQEKNDPAFKLILGAIYVLIGMAILAMCFDLMQEEIVAKFRWLGRKIGILSKEEDPAANQKNKALNDSEATRPSTAASTTMSSPTTKRNGKMIDDEYDDGWPTQRTSSAGRKLSPRNNIARVHPMGTGSDEGTLHQRAAGTKSN